MQNTPEVDDKAKHLVNEARSTQAPMRVSSEYDTNEFVTALLKAALTGVLRHDETETAPAGSAPSELGTSARLLAVAIARLELTPASS